MARSYRRDARGRFAGGGYSGQTGGRGARLMAKGQRAGGGVKMKAARVGGTVSKPRGLKPQQGISAQSVAVKPKPARLASRSAEQQRLRDTQAQELRALRNRKLGPAEIGRSQGQLRGLDLRGGPTNKLSLSSPNPPAFYSSKKQAAAHAKKHGWRASDVIPADSRLFSGWVVAQGVGNYIHALNKQGKVIRARNPGFW